MADTMTPKERWLAAIKLQPVDRLPFWPKLNGSYPRAQQEPFNSMTIDEINDWTGSDNHIGLPGFIKEERKNSRVEKYSDGNILRTAYHTRFGSTESVYRFDILSQSWHPVQMPIKNKDDIKIMTEYYRDCAVDIDEEKLEQAKSASERIGDNAITTNSIGESPLMHFVEWLAGVENAHYFLMDYQDEVEELFDVMHGVLLRETELFCQYSPADLLYMIENTSTTLISPKQYNQYCFKHITDYANIANGYQRLLGIHMCGHLKALLPDLAKLPVAAFEAFTSPPVGNTTLLDGRSECPDKCLIGGTNAILWTKTAHEIISKVEEDLDALPHHRGIAVTSAGVMPPLCTPETIKEVCEWVKEYKVRL